MEVLCKCCGQSIMPKIGSKIKSNISDFNITEGKIYEVLEYGQFFDCVVIENDLGEKEEYTLEYFSKVK